MILLLVSSNQSRFVRRIVLADIAVMLVSSTTRPVRDAGNGGIKVTPMGDCNSIFSSFFHDPMKSGIALVCTIKRFVSFDALSGHTPFFGRM